MLGSEKLPGFKSLDFYQSMFDGVDFWMSYWQPALKGFGRMQLEMAQLAAKNGQSTLTWAANLAACRTPEAIFRVNSAYIEALVSHQRHSVEKLTAAAVKATEPPPAFEVLKMPQRSSHDIIRLPQDGEDAQSRRVA